MYIGSEHPSAHLVITSLFSLSLYLSISDNELKSIWIETLSAR